MEQLFVFLQRFEKYAKNVDLVMAVALVGILGVMIVPLPAFMLDIALTVSLTSFAHDALDRALHTEGTRV